MREAHGRIRWLESEIQKELGFDCSSVPTGTSINTLTQQSGCEQRHLTPVNNPALANSSVSAPQSAASVPVDTVTVNDASETSLLALNASGELRYLGASSGAFFASCAAALVQSPALGTNPPTPAQAEVARNYAARVTPESTMPINLSQDEISLLLISYEMWVHPLYPLLDLDTLRLLVNNHADCLSRDCLDVNAVPRSQRIETTIVLVVVALGATNRSNTIKQLRVTRDSLVERVASTTAPSASSLCAASLKHLNSSLENIQASVHYVQMLLLFCIYSSYGPVGPSQWQLAGLAIRVSFVHCVSPMGKVLMKLTTSRWQLN